MGNPSDPETPYPDELYDYDLLNMFGFTKSLEEIDQMDTGRLQRVLQAENMRRVWKKPLKDMSKKDYDLWQEMKAIQKEQNADS